LGIQIDMPELAVLERFREIVLEHQETSRDLRPDLCETCFLIVQYEELLKECRELERLSKDLFTGNV